MFLNQISVSAKDYDKRFGQNGEPMFKFLDPTDAWAVLHFWIRVFYFFWRLFYHLNCRDVFPERTPIMRGGTKGEVINEAVELSRQNLINEAKKSPIKMLLDSPDPHGMKLLLNE